MKIHEMEKKAKKAACFDHREKGYIGTRKALWAKERLNNNKV